MAKPLKSKIVFTPTIESKSSEFAQSITEVSNAAQREIEKHPLEFDYRLDTSVIESEIVKLDQKMNEIRNSYMEKGKELYAEEVMAAGAVVQAQERVAMGAKDASEHMANIWELRQKEADLLAIQRTQQENILDLAREEAEILAIKKDAVITIIDAQERLQEEQENANRNAREYLLGDAAEREKILQKLYLQNEAEGRSEYATVKVKQHHQEINEVLAEALEKQKETNALKEAQDRVEAGILTTHEEQNDAAGDFNTILEYGKEQAGDMLDVFRESRQTSKEFGDELRQAHGWKNKLVTVGKRLVSQYKGALLFITGMVTALKEVYAWEMKLQKIRKEDFDADTTSFQASNNTMNQGDMTNLKERSTEINRYAEQNEGEQTVDLQKTANEYARTSRDQSEKARREDYKDLMALSKTAVAEGQSIDSATSGWMRIRNNAEEARDNGETYGVTRQDVEGTGLNTEKLMEFLVAQNEQFDNRDDVNKGFEDGTITFEMLQKAMRDQANNDGGIQRGYENRAVTTGGIDGTQDRRSHVQVAEDGGQQGLFGALNYRMAQARDMHDNTIGAGFWGMTRGIEHYAGLGPDAMQNSFDDEESRNNALNQAGIESFNEETRRRKAKERQSTGVLGAFNSGVNTTMDGASRASAWGMSYLNEAGGFLANKGKEAKEKGPAETAMDRSEVRRKRKEATQQRKEKRERDEERTERDKQQSRAAAQRELDKIRRETERKEKAAAKRKQKIDANKDRIDDIRIKNKGKASDIVDRKQGVVDKIDEIKQDQKEFNEKVKKGESYGNSGIAEFQKMIQTKVNDEDKMLAVAEKNKQYNEAIMKASEENVKLQRKLFELQVDPATVASMVFGPG